MKILFLTPGCFDKGGISRYSRYQIKAFNELFGAKNIKALSLLGPDAFSFEDPIEVDWYAGGNKKWHQVLYMLKIFLLVLTWRPSVIHVAHVNFSGFACLLGRLFRIKTILNVYGLEVWSGLSKDASYGLKNIQYVIADCHYTANYIEEAGFRKSGSTCVIWDCVDLDKFHPAQPDKEIYRKYNLSNLDKNFVVMSLGRLSKTAAHKGYDRLIKAFSSFAVKYPDARLVIAGKGDNRDLYEQMVRDNNLTDKVIFTGMVDETDLPGLYRCASVFSLVSDRGKGRGEGIPLTPLEAMACGVAIIVGNQDGSQEAVFQEQNGFVIDPFDLKQHQNVLETLIEYPEVLKEKREMAVQVAQTHFSYLEFKDKHETFYKSI